MCSSDLTYNFTQEPVVTPLGGSGTAHNHTITMAIQYVDVIIATKD